MGVRGLNTFVEEHGLNRENVNLKDMKEVLLREDPTRTPTLVIDTWNLAHAAFANVDWVTGGRPAVLLQTIRDFIHTLERAGIHPVFVIDGINPVDKIDVFVARKQKQSMALRKVFESVRNGEGLPSKLWRRPLISENIRDMLRKIGADFYCSLGDADQLTAQVAEDRKAFGIVSDDSDFLLYPSHPGMRIFSGSRLNLMTLDCAKMSSPGSLAKFLDLPPERVAVWATLFGCPLYGCPLDRGSLDLARTIDLYLPILPQLRGRDHQWGDDEQKLQRTLHTYSLLSRDENNNDAKSALSDDFMVEWRQKMDLLPGIDKNAPSYPKWRLTLERLGEKYQRGLLESNCSVVLGMHYVLPSAALDYSGPPGLPFLEDFTDRVRRSIFGILLQETKKVKGDPGELLVDEWIVRKEDPYQFTRDTLQCKTEPLWMDEDVDYYELLNEDNVSLQECRRTLFARAIHPKLDSTDLSLLEPSSILLFSKLYMLGEHLEEWEVKAIIMSHFKTLPQTARDLARLRFNHRLLRPRALHLATLYSYGTLADLNGFLGCPWPRECFDQFDKFDGCVFQDSYSIMEDEHQYGGESWHKFFLSQPQHVQDEMEGILQLLRSYFPPKNSAQAQPLPRKCFPILAAEAAVMIPTPELEDGEENKENPEFVVAVGRKRKRTKKIVSALKKNVPFHRCTAEVQQQV